MKQMRITWVVLFSVLALGIWYASAGTGEKQKVQSKQKGAAPVAESGTAAAEKTRPQVLRLGMHVSGIGKLDPHFATGSVDRAIVDMVFNGLLRYVPGRAPQIEADLVECIPVPEIQNSRQVWTFKLRRGVMFHPGPQTPAYELTADDVVYSLKKSADPSRSRYAGEYAHMRFEKVDKYTIRISLKRPLSPVLFLPKISDYGGGFIVSKRAVEAMGDEAFRTYPVGTGPFMFDSRHPGEKVLLRANKSYFRGQPRLDGVEIHFITDRGKRLTRLYAGELDVVLGPDNADIRKKIAPHGVFVEDLHGVGEVGVIHLNTSMEPLNDIRVRRAIAYALNRKTFLNASFKLTADPVYSPVPSRFLPGGIKKEDVETYVLDYAENREKARQLLAEAGLPNGFSLEMVASEKRIYRRTYEIMRDQLALVGITCQFKWVSHSEMHKLVRQGVNPIVIYFAWRPNADAYLTQFFHSDSIVKTGAKPITNFSHYNKIDKLIEAARLEIQPQKQINLWKQAQIRILNDVAAYPLYLTTQSYVRRSDVDYGHKLISVMAAYPQITEKTRFINR